MVLPAGTRIGRYQVEGSVGSGGMGEVYRARDTLLDRVVAIKLLPPGSGAPSLENEARAAAGLSHPHICALHDLGEHDGRLFLVMEFIDGETLAARLRRGPLPLAEALQRAREIAQALDAAHRHGIVHRDLKPSNVVLTKAGAKLVDFGIASASGARRAREQTVTRTGGEKGKDWSGTVAYMAPERIRGDPGDERADLFALGVVLYEMLAAKPPFAGDTDAAVGAAIVSDEPPPLAGAPAPVQRVVQRCLAKDPADRWQTAHDLAEALGWLSAEEPRPAARRSRGNWRHAAPRVAILAGVLALMALAFRALSPGGAGPPSLPVVVLMDSTLSERVYDPETRALGGTNSDDVTDAIRDLPLILVKEPTSALWHREEQVLREHPSLVMMHLSSFARPTAAHESDLQADAVERTRAFLAFVGVRDAATRFVVYTRGFDTDEKRNAWVSETEERFPALKGRVRMFHVPGGDEKATFRDPQVKQRVRELVTGLLALPSRP
jgi:serine/threonine protein kinase